MLKTSITERTDSNLSGKASASNNTTLEIQEI